VENKRPVVLIQPESVHYFHVSIYVTSGSLVSVTLNSHFIKLLATQTEVLSSVLQNDPLPCSCLFKLCALHVVHFWIKANRFQVKVTPTAKGATNGKSNI